MSTRRETLKNNSSTTLSASATNVATTLSVTDGSVFPSTGDFRILVDSEIMLVTGRSTNTLTVVRGQEGTTAVAHSSAAVVTLILTAGALQQYGRDNDPLFDSSRPPYRIEDSSGNTLTSSDFTTVNLSTSTITDANGTIVIKKAGNNAVGENITAIVKSAPTAPNALTAGVRLCYPISSTSAVPSCGVGFRESSSGKLYFISINNDSASGGLSLSVYKYTSPTVISSVPLARKVLANVGPTIWLKAVDDNSSLRFSVSHDGVNWIEVWSESRTAFMSGGPDQFMFGANNYSNNYDTYTTLVAWNEG